MAELAPYAARPEHSRGRRFDEDALKVGTSSSAIGIGSCIPRLFGAWSTRLKSSSITRGSVSHPPDAQYRGCADRAFNRTCLKLNEDLTEAIALAHDLGHTPFGHAGQDALHACMRSIGGFEHNLQSLRVVDMLETRYAAFDGLNLTFETREGILNIARSPTQESSVSWASAFYASASRPSRRKSPMWPMRLPTTTTM